MIVGNLAAWYLEAVAGNGAAKVLDQDASIIHLATPMFSFILVLDVQIRQRDHMGRARKKDT